MVESWEGSSEFPLVTVNLMGSTMILQQDQFLTKKHPLSKKMYVDIVRYYFRTCFYLVASIDITGDLLIAES